MLPPHWTAPVVAVWLGTSLDAAVAEAGPLVAGLLVAGLLVGLGVAVALGVGWTVGVLLAVTLGVGVAVWVGVPVPPPAGAVADESGFGAGVGEQATAGSPLFTFLDWPDPVQGRVMTTPGGSFPRPELAVVPPPPRLLPALAVPEAFTRLIGVPVSWLRTTTPTTTMATAAETANTGLSHGPADPSRPGGLGAPRWPPAGRRPRPPSRPASGPRADWTRLSAARAASIAGSSRMRKRVPRNSSHSVHPEKTDRRDRGESSR